MILSLAILSFAALGLAVQTWKSSATCGEVNIDAYFHDNYLWGHPGEMRVTFKSYDANKANEFGQYIVEYDDDCPVATGGSCSFTVSEYDNTGCADSLLTIYLPERQKVMKPAEGENPPAWDEGKYTSAPKLTVERCSDVEMIGSAASVLIVPGPLKIGPKDDMTVEYVEFMTEFTLYDPYNTIESCVAADGATTSHRSFKHITWMCADMTQDCKDFKIEEASIHTSCDEVIFEDMNDGAKEYQNGLGNTWRLITAHSNSATTVRNIDQFNTMVLQSDDHVTVENVKGWESQPSITVDSKKADTTQVSGVSTMVYHGHGGNGLEDFVDSGAIFTDITFSDFQKYTVIGHMNTTLTNVNGVTGKRMGNDVFYIETVGGGVKIVNLAQGTATLSEGWSTQIAPVIEIGDSESVFNRPEGELVHIYDSALTAFPRIRITAEQGKIRFVNDFFGTETDANYVEWCGSMSVENSWSNIFAFSTLNLNMNVDCMGKGLGTQYIGTERLITFTGSQFKGTTATIKAASDDSIEKVHLYMTNSLLSGLTQVSSDASVVIELADSSILNSGIYDVQDQLSFIMTNFNFTGVTQFTNSQMKALSIQALNGTFGDLMMNDNLKTTVVDMDVDLTFHDNAHIVSAGSGSLKLNDIQLNDIDGFYLETESGDIEFTYPGFYLSPVTLKSKLGDIRFTPAWASTYNFHWILDAPNGRVDMGGDNAWRDELIIWTDLQTEHHAEFMTRNNWPVEIDPLLFVQGTDTWFPPADSQDAPEIKVSTEYGNIYYNVALTETVSPSVSFSPNGAKLSLVGFESVYMASWSSAASIDDWMGFDNLVGLSKDQVHVVVITEEKSPSYYTDTGAERPKIDSKIDGATHTFTCNRKEMGTQRHFLKSWCMAYIIVPDGDMNIAPSETDLNFEVQTNFLFLRGLTTSKFNTFSARDLDTLVGVGLIAKNIDLDFNYGQDYPIREDDLVENIQLVGAQWVGEFTIKGRNVAGIVATAAGMVGTPLVGTADGVNVFVQDKDVCGGDRLDDPMNSYSVCTDQPASIRTVPAGDGEAARVYDIDFMYGHLFKASVPKDQPLASNTTFFISTTAPIGWVLVNNVKYTTPDGEPMVYAEGASGNYFEANRRVVGDNDVVRIDTDCQYVILHVPDLTGASVHVIAGADTHVTYISTDNQLQDVSIVHSQLAAVSLKTNSISAERTTIMDLNTNRGLFTGASVVGFDSSVWDGAVNFPMEGTVMFDTVTRDDVQLYKVLVPKPYTLDEYGCVDDFALCRPDLGQVCMNITSWNQCPSYFSIPSKGRDPFNTKRLLFVPTRGKAYAYVRGVPTAKPNGWDDPVKPSSSGMEGWLIAVIVIVCIIAAIGIAILVIFFVKRDLFDKMFGWCPCGKSDGSTTRSSGAGAENTLVFS